MAGRRGSPTLRRRQLGITLRHLRERRGITIEQVAERLECSASKISRIETGVTGVNPRDVRDLAAIYALDADNIDLLVEMAREAKQRGWWQLYGDVLITGYVGMEAAADAILAYESLVVPGLLQTVDYARALIRAARPGIEPGELERRVRIRINRQSLISQDDPLDLKVVLDEAVLRRPVGGPDVMRRQVDHLIAMAERPMITIQVLPFAAGAHAGLDGSFAILLFSETSGQDLVFASHAAGGLFLEKHEELDTYGSIFGQLRESALAPDESVGLLKSLAKEPEWKLKSRG